MHREKKFIQKISMVFSNDSSYSIFNVYVRICVGINWPPRCSALCERCMWSIWALCNFNLPSNLWDFSLFIQINAAVDATRAKEKGNLRDQYDEANINNDFEVSKRENSLTKKLKQHRSPFFDVFSGQKKLTNETFASLGQMCQGLYQKKQS